MAFSLISDIVLTMSLYLAVVMDTVYKASETLKSVILLLVLVVGIIAGYIFGKIADTYGYKKILMITCYMIILNCIIFFSCSAPRTLYIVGIV
ncbi:MAG: MFS transporter [bacterium]